MRVLVTGGAGFIGSHLVDALVARGHDVAILDNLAEGVHDGRIPDYVNPGATYTWGDVRDRSVVAEALRGVEAVFHHASLIEVAAGERDVGRYVDMNVRGTAVFLDEVVAAPDPVRRLVLASSAAVYGEGAYRCADHGPVEAQPREAAQLASGRWEAVCPTCGGEAVPLPTDEERVLRPISTYGWTKLIQERLTAAAAADAEIPAVVLRYANVYGPRQRGGPYTGAVTAFLHAAQEQAAPTVHEDGRQRRDFVYVEDVVRATVRALETAVRGTETVNVGSGTPLTIRELAERVLAVADRDVAVHQEGTYRPGDVRHLWFDVARAERVLGFRARTKLEHGLRASIESLE